MDPEAWVVRTVQELQLLTPERLAQARSELARSPHPQGLLGLLRERYLDPPRVQALQQAWLAAQSVAARPTSPGPPSRVAQSLSGSQSSSGEQRRVGPFELVRELARGGMGVVWVARRPGLDRLVALKQLLVGDAGPGQAQLKRFLDEARLAARLQHPNIVRVHEAGEERGLPWFAMDLVEGESLHARIKRQGPLPPREAAALFVKLARALAYAHGQRLLHRDLKPHNVLLGQDGEPVLTDFGLAKAVDESGQGGLTRQGDVMGTPSYMPPEQADGAHDRIDQRADVYSLGATLYEALTAQPPFGGKNPMAIIAAVMTQEPTPPRRLVGAIDRDLETIVLRCLEKDPLCRYPSATALAEDLERWLAHQPIEARPPGPLERAGKWVRRNRAVAAVGGLLSLCLVVGGVAASLLLLHARAERALADARGAAALQSERAAERGRLAAAARAEAEEALAGIALPTSGLAAAARQAALDLALGQALRAGRAADRWSSLDPDDPAARRAAHQAASRLAEVAAAGEQWAVARQALEQALATGVEPEATRLAQEELEVRRTAEAARRRGEVEAIIDEVESGRAAARVEGQREAVMRLSRYTEPELVRLMAERLDGVTSELRALQRELYLSGCEPTPAEARAGAEPIRVDDELQRLFAGQLRPGDLARLEEVEQRVLGRARRENPRVASFREVHLARVAARIPEGRRELAPILAEALGWIGDAERGLGPVERYLAAEADETRAARALVPLSQLGGRDALLELQAGLRRGGGPLRSGLQLLLRRSDEPPPAGRGRDLVNYHMVRGELPELAAALERQLAARPDDHESRAVSAWVSGLRGQTARARQELARVEAAAPTTGRPWAYLAVTLHLLHELAAARQAADRAVELAPNDAETWWVRGFIRRNTGDPAGALADLDRADQLQPVDFQIHRERTLTLVELGRLDDALAAAVRMEETFPAAGDACAVRAEIELRRGQADRARSAADRAVELDPRSVASRTIRAAVREAVGDLAGSIADLRAAVELAPGTYMARSNLGSALERAGRLEDALAELSRAIELAPSVADEWARRGRLRTKLGQLEEARKDLERALELAPDHVPALAGVADLQRARGDLPRALETWRRVVALAPDDPKVLREWGAFLIASAPDRAEEALEVAERGLSRQPDDATLLFVRGTARVRLGKLAEARADFDRVLEQDPTDAMTWNNRGHIRRLQGDPQGARADFDRALEANPDLLLGWGNRTDLRREQGDFAGALADAEEALTRAPGDYDFTWARANALLLLGREGEALAAFRPLAGKDPWAALWIALRGKEPRALDPHAKVGGWVGAIVQAARGELGEAALLAEAERAEGEARAARRCEARCFLALIAELRGDAAGAKAHYAVAAAEGTPRMIERQWAEVQLR